MLHAVGMGQACVQRWKDTVYPKEADGGTEMLGTCTKLDIIPGSNVMSFRLELQIKRSGNIKRKSSLDWKNEKTFLEVPLELGLGRCKASHIVGVAVTESAPVVRT